GRDPVAQQQLLLPGRRDSADRPADREALEQQLGSARQCVVLVQPAMERLAVLRARRRCQRATKRQHVSVGVGVVRRRRNELLAVAAALPHHAVAAAAFWSAARTSPVTGSACPGQAALGPISASLAIERLACSVLSLKAGCGIRGRPLIAVSGFIV